MNILFFADPNSIHDKKWIEYMISNNLGKIFLLPRRLHDSGVQINGVVNLSSIKDFSITRFYQTLITAVRIRKIIRRHQISLIHILYAEPNALWCLFRRYFDVPIIITSRGTDVLKTIPEAFNKKTIINLLVAPAYKNAFQLADWVTCTSKQQLNSILKFSGRSKGISLIRTGVDVKRLLTNTADHYPLNENYPYILFPRYIKPLYNHEFCLEAIALLPEEIKANYKMVFVGKDIGDKSYQQKLEKMMASIQDAEFVFLPRLIQEQIIELYKHSSLVVMTPLSDGSPVSAMEAMLCKIPVILPPLNYDQEIFGQTVFHLRTWDYSELSQLITSILTGRISIKEKVEEAYNTVVEKGNFPVEMEKVIGLYHSLLKE